MKETEVDAWLAGLLLPGCFIALLKGWSFFLVLGSFLELSTDEGLDYFPFFCWPKTYKLSEAPAWHLSQTPSHSVTPDDQRPDTTAASLRTWSYLEHSHTTAIRLERTSTFVNTRCQVVLWKLENTGSTSLATSSIAISKYSVWCFGVFRNLEGAERQSYLWLLLEEQVHGMGYQHSGT